MRAIIPAAGIGERLRPLTFTRSKVLIPVAGKPILGHILDRIAAAGIGEVTVIIGYMGERVMEYLNRNYKMNFSFIEQGERRGLGHAVGIGLSDSDEPALVILGDVIPDINLIDFSSGEENKIGVIEVDNPERFGIVETDGDNAIRLVEKPKEPQSNLAIAGVYLFQNQKKIKKAINYLIDSNIKTKGEYQLTDALQVLLESGERIKVERIERCYDCGTKQAILEANRHLLEKGYNPDFAKARAEDSAKLATESKGCNVILPVFIHPGAEVRRSVIGPYVSIGEGAIVEESVVEDSIVCDRAHIKEMLIKGSIIGSESVVSGKFYKIDVGDNSRYEIS